MLDYEIQPNTRRCAATGRDLQPGEKYHSVLIEHDGKLVRQDFAEGAWSKPPAGAFCFWAGRVPSKDQVRKMRIDADLLLDCFERLDGSAGADKINFRYVLALLLIRSKRLKYLESRMQDGREILQVRCQRGGKRYDVVNPGLTEQELAAVQDEVLQVVGWE
jgi:hypothetical protein